MRKLERFTLWKRRLMRDLNRGRFVKSEWQRFVRAAHKNMMFAMAHDMQERLDYYKENWNG